MIVLMNNGHGQFTQSTYPAGDVPVDITIGDLGNGRPDIAVGAGIGNQYPRDPGVNLYMNNGHGVFTPQPLIATPGLQPEGIAIGDFNGDGRPDLVTQDDAPGGLQSADVMVNNGHGGYTDQDIPDQEQFTGEEYDGFGGITAGDLNSDGRSDFVVTNGNADSMTVFMSTNTRTGLGFTQTTIPTDGQPDQIAIGHVNSSDGAQDIVVGDQQGNADLFTNTTPQLGLGGLL
jgi:hypothetical protein